MISTKNALVLAGGGVAGIAWETGFLLGVQDEAPDLVAQIVSRSTTLIGTSAGSTVAAQLATGNELQSLFDKQVGAETAELNASIDMAELGAAFAGAMQGAASPQEMRRRVGVMALQAETPAPSVRRAVIEARLTQDSWPDWPLRITAVDTATGEAHVFDAASGTNLVDVVAASCAVPGVWPPVEIAGRIYMDGGVRSLANADLAVGAERVLVLVPSSESSPLGQSVPDEQLSALGTARRHVVYADAASLDAMGANALAPESRIPSARAGRDQGRRQAAELLAFWSAAGA